MLGTGQRARVAALLLLALVLLLSAGATWAMSNPGLQSYRPASATVVTVDESSATVTVRYETVDGDEVDASTDRLTFVPPEGAPIAIRYDPDDPSQVVMDGYASISLVTQVLVGLFAVTLAAAWFSFRRG